MRPELREERIRQLITSWGSVAIVLVTWPILFLLILFGYLNYPVVTLVLIGGGFLAWRSIRRWPGALRRIISGKYRQY